MRRLVGLRVKVLHRKRQLALGEEAARRLRAAGCEVTVERGKEGGPWEPFWGHAYFFRDGLADETDTVVSILSGAGFLEAAGSRSGEPGDVDLVLWLEP